MKQSRLYILIFCVICFLFATPPKKIRIWLIGDSTVCTIKNLLQAMKAEGRIKLNEGRFWVTDSPDKLDEV